MTYRSSRVLPNMIILFYDTHSLTVLSLPSFPLLYCSRSQDVYVGHHIQRDALTLQEFPPCLLTISILSWISFPLLYGSHVTSVQSNLVVSHLDPYAPIAQVQPPCPPPPPTRGVFQVHPNLPPSPPPS